MSNISSHNNIKHSNLKPLDFEIIQENWNSYTLDDGTRLKGRIFVTRTFQDKLDLKNIVIDLSDPIYIVVSASSNNIGKSNIPESTEYSQLERKEVNIIDCSEKLNIYKIPEITINIKVKLVVSDIYRAVDKYEKFGLPFYFVNGTTIVTSSKTS